MEEKRYLRTLGGLSLHEGGPEGEVLLGTSKSLAVLAYVAMAPGRQASRRHLAALLWPGTEPQRGRRSLRQALYYLSKRAGTELLRSDDGHVRVAEDRLEVDAWAFDRALEAGDLERAVALYGGPFLEGFGADGGREFESWSESQNERIWAGLKAAYHELVTRALEAGAPEKAVRAARAYAEVNPLDEKARRMLIRAQLAAGDRVGAYRSYEAFRTLLREELEVEPGEELRERMDALREEIFGGAVEGPIPRPAAQEDGDPDRTEKGEGGGARSSDRPAPEQGGDDGRRGGDVSRVRRAGDGVRAPARWLADRGGSAFDPSSAWRVAAVAMVAGVVAAAGALTLRGAADGEGPAGWAGADGRLRMATGGQRGWLEGRIRGGEMASTRSAESWTLVDPTGRRVAKRVRSAEGVDVAVLDRATGDTLARTRRAADELPYDWSPDGREVLYRSGEPVDGGDYRWRYEVLDVETGESRDLGVVSHGAPYPRADWSPRGSRIAMEALGSEGWDVWVVDADGERPRRVIDHPGDDRHPAWSPDGAWLVFSSDRGATRDLYLARPDGTGLERLTYGPEDEFAPAWLTDRHLAYAAGEADRTGRGRHQLRLMDVPTRRSRTVTTGLDVSWLHRALDEGLARRQVETIEIPGGDRVAGPGQRLPLEARVTDAAGDEVSRAAACLRWSSADTAVARVSGDGTVRALAPGETTVTASTGGWRADSVRIVVRRPAVRNAPVSFTESWEGGLRPDRWVPFGEPAPGVERLRPASGPDASPERTAGLRAGRASPAVSGPGAPEASPRAAFVSNGDENHDSGAVSRERFDLSRGLTVEFRASLPFSGRSFQALHAGLVRETPGPDRPHFTLKDSPLGDLAILVLDGRSVREHGIWIEGRGSFGLPALERPGDWHRYALQLEPDGTVSWVVDGRIRWRSPGPVLADRPDSARVVLGGRSLHADLLVGPVTVRRGVRYAVGD